MSAPAATPRPPHLPRTGRSLAFGLLVGATLGAVEMGLRLLGEDDPSVLRRSTELVGYAVSWYAPAGALLFLVGAALLRLARVRLPAGRGRWRSARGVATLCVLSLAGSWLAAALRDSPGQLSPAPVAPPRDAPNLLVICVDTLRADALGCYGAAPGATPAIDELARRGALFENALASASWTFPSVASILTSVLPVRHGCVDFDRAIAADLATLPGALADAGYECDGLVGNPLLEPPHGFARGFHFYDAYGHDLEGELLLTRVFSKSLRVTKLLSYKGRRPILAWQASFPFVTTRLTAYTLDEDLNERVFEHLDFSGDRPRFLYVQYVSPHTPYLEHPLRFLKTPLPLDAAHLDELRERYRGEVGYTDAMLAELLARLEGTGFLERAYVVITSDHGEEFLEHGGFEHGYGLHREVVRVPLVVAGPGIAPGTRISEPVQLLDVAPTLLDLAGVMAPKTFQGRSLRPLLESRQGEASRTPAYAEISSRFLTPDEHDDERPRRALLQTAVDTGRWKVVRRRSAAGALLREEIYDLERDPLELAPLASRAEAPGSLGPLLQGLETYEATPRAGAATELSAEQIERMQGLGYVDGGKPSEEP